MISTVCSDLAYSSFLGHEPFASLVHPPSPFSSENRTESGLTPLR